jgi:hypothetical protein
MLPDQISLLSPITTFSFVQSLVYLHFIYTITNKWKRKENIIDTLSLGIMVELKKSNKLARDMFYATLASRYSLHDFQCAQ